MVDKVGVGELATMVKHNAVIKERYPGIPDEAEIYRYRHNTVRGSTIRTVSKKQQKEEEVEGDKAAPHKIDKYVT